ncbi:MAG: glycosyl transferase family protein [Aliiglaciecola sp.]
MSAAFKQYIQAIGRGQRAGRTLSQSEAYDAMSMIISGSVTAEQKGAFLMLLRVREETPEELAGFVEAFDHHTIKEVTSLETDLDMGCYAGKRRQHPWFVLSALLLAQTGKRLFLHGTHEPDSKRLYLSAVLPSLGIPSARNATQAQSQLTESGMCYMDLIDVNPQLDEIIQLREQFGLRSCANTLARMLNPSRARFSLQGVFHKGVDEKHSQTAALLGNSDVLCFRGEGGEIEFNPERDVTLQICRARHQSDISVSAVQQNWQMKPKLLDCKKLVHVWQGEEDSYAFHTIVGTLAIMLTLVNDLEWTDAYRYAKELWLSRNKTWPFDLSC